MSKSNLEILAYDETPLGLLCLRRRELLSQPGTIVTEVSLNHEFLMSSLYTDSEEALSRRALELHAGDDLKVMVGGLGLGYTAAEALKSPRVKAVEVIELLPQVIGWMRDGLVPLSDALNSEPRLTVTQADVYQRLTGPAPVNASMNATACDLILIDVDHSPDDRLGNENSGFYTEAGLTASRQHLAPGGLLAVWSYAESSPFVDALRAVFDEVHVEPVTHLNEMIHQEHTDWLFFAR